MVASSACRLGTELGLRSFAPLEARASQRLGGTSRSTPRQSRFSAHQTYRPFSCRHEINSSSHLGSLHSLHSSGYNSLAGQKNLKKKRDQFSRASVSPHAVLTPPKPVAPSSDRPARRNLKESDPPDQPSEKQDSRSHETDVVIIGAGQ